LCVKQEFLDEGGREPQPHREHLGVEEARDAHPVKDEEFWRRGMTHGRP
jgi:hypothetical protein